MDRLRDNSRYHRLSQEYTHHAFVQVLVEHVVIHMKVQTYARARRVCTDWYGAFNENKRCQKLKFFQPLFTPMFSRFVRAVNEIDMTPSQKYQAVFGRDKPITQEEYEIAMLSRAVYEAILGYGIRKSKDFIFSRANGEKIQGDIFNEPDFTLLSGLTRAHLLNTGCGLKDYYQLDAIAKVTVVPVDTGKIYMPIKPHEFTTTTIKELFEKIREIEEHPMFLNAFQSLKGLIVRHSILPINDGNAVLSVSPKVDTRLKIEAGLFFFFSLVVVLNEFVFFTAHSFTSKWILLMGGLGNYPLDYFILRLCMEAYFPLTMWFGDAT